MSRADTPRGAASDGAGGVLARVRAEAALSWQFISGDLSTTIYSASVFMAVAIATAPTLPLESAGPRFALGVLYFWFYIYHFCLGNQLGGIEEDRLNKPHRPLPSGRVSVRGARIRWVVITVGFIAYGAALGVAEWALLWAVTTIAHNFGPLDKLWWSKNPITMFLGTVAQLAAAWEIIRPMADDAWVWVVVIGLWVGITSPAQDIRDIEGDAANGRKTLPIVMGEGPARRVISVFWVVMALVVHFTLTGGGGSAVAVACDWFILAYHAYVIYRLNTDDSREKDRKTYMIYTYLYCSILLCGFVFL